jgi:Cd2+/Zn2+-exporting ATPase
MLHTIERRLPEMGNEKECPRGSCSTPKKTNLKKIVLKKASVSIPKTTNNGQSPTTDIFFVGDLDCADCAAKVEKAVRRLEGVAEATLSFATGKMKVAYDTTQMDTFRIAKIISGLGYKVEIRKSSSQSGLKKSVFLITGLDCGDCATKLEKKIMGLTGVSKASVNFGAGKLTVEHTITDAAIIKAIQESGYNGVSEGKQEGLTPPSAQKWWQNSRLIATVISGILLVILTILEWVGFQEYTLVPFYIVTLVIGGYHTAKSGYYSLRSLTFDMNFLMSVAIIGAAAIGQWSEAATVVFLFSLGNTLQAYTMDKTRQSIRALMELSPSDALVRRNNIEQRLSVDEIEIGDIIIVKPGERIPMDGDVTDGESSVNQATITGESMPVEKQLGDFVYAGTLNEHGSLEIAVTKLAQDSTLSKIMNLVEEAQAQKAPSQQFVDVFAKYYTPAVLVFALGIAVIPWLIFQQPFDIWFYRALVLLVISCPCALVISTPVSIVSAIGNASRNGVLIKGGAYLEKMGAIKAIAFDKTGTLTIGQPKVTDVLPMNGKTEEEILSIASSIEKFSEHPVAQAIVNKAKGLPFIKATNFKALVGKGVQANIDESTIYIGNSRLFEELQYTLDPIVPTVEKLENQGKTVMLVGTKEVIYGILAVADTVRENSLSAVEALRNVGISAIIMLTGDNKRVANAIADRLGLNAFYSNLLPEDKVTTIQQLADQYGSVAMVGDGVNDAPALATADIGIAMGVAGSDVALETADIALMSDDLAKLGYVMKLSRKTLSVIKQNIIFAIVIKIIFLTMTVLGAANLWMAVFADMGASMLVTLNGMRLVRKIKS